jgi:hypothetical protein
VVAPVIGTGTCAGCGATISLRKGYVIKYCGCHCGGAHRQRLARDRRRKDSRVRYVLTAIREDPELARAVARALRIASTRTLASASSAAPRSMGVSPTCGKGLVNSAARKR